MLNEELLCFAKRLNTKFTHFPIVPDFILHSVFDDQGISNVIFAAREEEAFVISCGLLLSKARTLALMQILGLMNSLNAVGSLDGVRSPSDRHVHTRR
jgi:hypothetical protein